MIFDNSPINIEFLLLATASANNAFGLSSVFSTSRALFLSCSAFNACNSFMPLSGFEIILSIVSDVAYAPCFRIDGRTSDVTQSVKASACGLRDWKITLYKLDSLIKFDF